MNLLPYFFCFIALAAITLQDFSQRQIAWYWLPILLAGIILLNVQRNELKNMISFFITNVCFVVFQLIVLIIYFSIKNKKLTNIIDHYIGLGDVLFFIVLCTVFSPLNFLVFYIISLLLILLTFFTYNTVSKKIIQHIPLAGAMALCLIFCFVYKYTNNNFNFYNDSRMIELLTYST